MQAYNTLPDQRIHSVDVLRGITILLMIFVNEVAGVRNLPQAFYHMPSDADGMTMVDWVFPGFLFIVGMSIPFALNSRIQKGDTFWQLQQHILIRTIALLVLGVFMVNAERTYHAEPVGLPVQLWSLLFYVAVILVWNQYPHKQKTVVYLLRGIGVASLLVLAALYRGEGGSGYLQPRWWGILGLIGWSYLYASIFYQLAKGNRFILMGCAALCILIYAGGNTFMSEQVAWLGWTRSQAGHASHTAITLCGVVLSLIFFDQSRQSSLRSRLNEALIFAGGLFVAGYLLRPYFLISKNHATPTWSLYSAVFSIFLYILCYWIVDLKRIRSWTHFFRPAAENPLLTYIVPFILWASYSYLHFYPLPAAYRAGLTGVLFCIVYAVVIVWIVRGLNRIHISLRL